MYQGELFEAKGFGLKTLNQIHVCCASRFPEPNVISPDGQEYFFINLNFSIIL